LKKLKKGKKKKGGKKEKYCFVGGTIQRKEKTEVLAPGLERRKQEKEGTAFARRKKEKKRN